MDLLEVLAAKDRAIRDLRSELSRQLPLNDRPVSDPQGFLSQRPNDLYPRRGVVVDFLPFYNWYIVNPDDGGIPIVCTWAQGNATHPVAARRLGTLGPAENVYFIYGRSAALGVIIAVEPKATFGKDIYLHEYISQASATTPAGEALQYLHRTAGNEIGDRSSGAAFDETGVGEAGWMTGTGTGVFVDPFMTFLRADENCGIWAFLYDRMLRIAGQQLQIWTPTWSKETQADNIDLSGIEGQSNYLWESLGRFASGAAGKKVEAQEAQVDKPYKGIVEPKEDKQIPFRRITTYTGRLGGGGERRIVCLPPDSEDEFFTVGGKQKLIGVYESHLAPTGDYTAASARGITFAHVPPFAVPVPEMRAEDIRGDKGGKSKDDKIADGLAGTVPVGSAAGNIVLDNLAYLRNWSAGHPFKYLGKDWHTPAGEEFPAVELYELNAPPEPVEHKVDARYDAKYYNTLSLFSILPDGRIVIGGPGGEEIILGGGEIRLRARNIVIESAKDCVVLAGRDLALRSNRSIDLAAATGDVRVKGDKYVEVLAGNSGTGALILESRSTGTTFDLTKTGTDVIASGIVLRSKGIVSTISNAAYFRTTGGQITIDAGDGKAAIETRAARMDHHISGDVQWLFGDSQTTRMSGSLLTVAGGAEVNGDVIIAGGLLTDRSIQVASGHIATSQAKSFLGKVASLEGVGLTQAQEIVQRPPEDVATFTASAKQRKLLTTNQIYAENKIGNANTVASSWFSFRSTEQCGTDDFKLQESRWAAHVRLSGATTSVWTEPAVTTAGDATYPFPGKTAWLTAGYLTFDPTLFDPQTGRAPDADEDVYGEAEYKAQQEKPVDGNYPIDV